MFGAVAIAALATGMPLQVLGELTAVLDGPELKEKKVGRFNSPSPACPPVHGAPAAASPSGVADEVDR